MYKIIFIPTWRCNLRCSYCDYEIKEKTAEGYIYRAFNRFHRVERELEWWEWIEHLERFEPFLLEMTGGEPLCYKDLDKLLLHLRLDCRWAITSNTLNREMIKKLPAYNCLAWTASYHYQKDKEFLDNLYILRHKRIIPRVTIVVTPENFNTAVEKIKMIDSEGYGVNIHPVLKMGFSWEKDMDKWNELLGMADGKRIIFVRDISYRWTPQRYDYCHAGSNYFCLMPDGKVLRCYSQILTDKNLGYIWDFKPFKLMTPCDMECMFPCDRQVTKGGRDVKQKLKV